MILLYIGIIICLSWYTHAETYIVKRKLPTVWSFDITPEQKEYIELLYSDQYFNITEKFKNAFGDKLVTYYDDHITLNALQLDIYHDVDNFMLTDDIEFIEIDYEIQEDGQLNDMIKKDWGQKFVKAPISPSREVTIAVLDTGIDLEHPDLKDLLVPGINVVFKEPPIDRRGHGTHCAGIIAAALGGKNVKLMPIKILDDNGSGSYSNALYGLNYAIANGAEITSNSWGGNASSKSFKEVIRISRILHVFSAGNNKENLDTFEYAPGGMISPNKLTVASLESKNKLSSFSNYSQNIVDIAAPGTDIYSLAPGSNKLVAKSGTSMAAPFVTAGVAIARANMTNSTSEEVIQYILENSDSQEKLTNYVNNGRILNLKKIAGLTNSTIGYSLRFLFFVIVFSYI